MNKITQYLNRQIVGNVFDQPSVLQNYATGRSILEIKPRLVALPLTTSDVQQLVRFSYNLAAKGYDLPITVRGSGLSKTGANLGNGLIISTEHLDEIKEIDERSRLVCVQSGVTLAKLNATLAVYGLTLPLLAHPQATIGGLISTLTTDPAAKKYGGIFYYIDRIEAVLSNGEVLQTTSLNSRGLKRLERDTSFSASIHRDIKQLLDQHFDTIEDITTHPRQFAGYSLVTQVARHRNFDLAPLFAAAEGTLGVITEVILRCEPLPRPPLHCLASFNAIRPALDFAKQLATLEPVTIDLYDARIFRLAAESGKSSRLLKDGSNFHILASFHDSPRRFQSKLRKLKKLTDIPLLTEQNDNAADFLTLRSGLIAYLNHDIDGQHPPLVDDVRIPKDQLPAFLTELRQLELLFERELPLFGSFATDTYHVRPAFDLTDFGQRKSALRFITNYAELVAAHQGSLSGGSSEGRIKAIVTTSRLGVRELALYHEIKNVFDPYHILNPDVKLGSSLLKVARHLRTTPIPGPLEP
ncbi:MAG: FAD-binding oxidoreductase [Candidatus Saccharibacteria bacterium]|nr:FAD-binding oxidoreductase [Candidatus Saccharibacteria bacterium]